MPYETADFSSAYAIQASFISKLQESGKHISDVVWYEVEVPSMIESRIYDPHLCNSCRLKLQIKTTEGEVVNISFDLDQEMCSLDKRSMEKIKGVTIQ